MHVFLSHYGTVQSSDITKLKVNLYHCKFYIVYSMTLIFFSLLRMLGLIFLPMISLDLITGTSTHPDIFPTHFSRRQKHDNWKFLGRKTSKVKFLDKTDALVFSPKVEKDYFNMQ